MNFRFGIEHEVAFLRPNGSFADFSNTTYEELAQLIEGLPRYTQDYPQLRIGDAGIKVKRWYIEGFERFSTDGVLVDCSPKGIEIRTTIHPDIEGAIKELTESFDQLNQVAQSHGFQPALVSFNPFQPDFSPLPPLNKYEQERRQQSPEKQTAHIPMMTYGPDLNLSIEGLSLIQLIDIAKKLTYYSPYLIPFSYSSPFYQGDAWSGLSVRTFQRTGARPAAMVFLENQADLLAVQPSLTKIARLPAEVGRIEFKAFDSCGDFTLYASLLSLLKGLILDQSLPGRATVPDKALHQRSARLGFADEDIYKEANVAISAATEALHQDPDQARLVKLETMIKQRISPAKKMIETYRQGSKITDILRQGYLAQAAVATRCK